MNPTPSQAYIAALRNSSITEKDGLGVMIFLAEHCDVDGMLPRRKYTARMISRNTGIEPSRLVLRRIRRLVELGVLSSIKVKSQTYFHLADASKLPVPF